MLISVLSPVSVVKKRLKGLGKTFKGLRAQRQGLRPSSAVRALKRCYGASAIFLARQGGAKA